MQQSNKKSQIYWLVLTGILMSITLVLKVIFHFIPIINGYGMELYLIGYIYGLILIDDNKWKYTFWGITPWLLLVMPPSIVNFWDLLLEYILSLYIFMPFIFWSKLTKKKHNTKKSFVIEILCFSALITTLIFVKLFIHTVAGVLWWTPNDWYGSFIFNLPIYGVTLAIVLPVAIIIYRPIVKMIQSDKTIAQANP